MPRVRPLCQAVDQGVACDRIADASYWYWLEPARVGAADPRWKQELWYCLKHAAQPQYHVNDHFRLFELVGDASR